MLLFTVLCFVRLARCTLPAGSLARHLALVPEMSEMVDHKDAHQGRDYGKKEGGEVKEKKKTCILFLLCSRDDRTSLALRTVFRNRANYIPCWISQALQEPSHLRTAIERWAGPLRPSTRGRETEGMRDGHTEPELMRRRESSRSEGA